MKTIDLTNGMSALVDDDDYAAISQFRWRGVRDGKTFYAVRTARIDGKVVCVRMHRAIMEFPECFVDHKNRNGLDNRRSNLRLATNAQNQMNADKQRIHVPHIAAFGSTGAAIDGWPGLQ
jgi:hypothetical protein